MDKSYQVIVIGAGAAGLMCGATAAAKGKKVLVLDHANKMAKKVLMSGGGRCNFTNLYVEPDNFLSHNPHFCKSALSRYTQWDFISLVEKHGIDYYEKTLGQLFCKTSSKEIRDLLQKECQHAGASIQLKCEVNTIEPIEPTEENPSRFKLTTNIGEVDCNSLVIATGGLSIPTMGATGFGYQVAQQFGHKIYPTRAGLTPLTFSGKQLEEFKSLAGNSIEAMVSCKDQSFKEAILFTHKGLSGPAILQISNYWLPGEPIHINLMPNVDIDSWLAKNRAGHPELSLKNCLAKVFSQAVASYFCQLLGINCKLKQLDHKQTAQVVELLANWTIYPSGLEGYRVAEVTLGGVDTSEISSKTFESKRQPGLFFIGEVLDVTGHLGGFNFQWAWASGHAAGSSL
ncbi:NAD(P)/FAD-dependent oxidoreductase [Aliikangiella marina]|uniref:NAD(P)/FAD-dependent oxidoreductase n=1 Tax=Aliikangiella marina TaxID=1712262 RepID=A0A545TID9_9GAMM|nr:NAD(P)/FAD-dependent oxidoreductase [Aliikangiella marina]TQV76992.1 NAD(P)/FAD-dependent oxidoreductase [Aliikangiella marina]